MDSFSRLLAESQDGDALVAALRKDRHDYATWFVYADYLEDSGRGGSAKMARAMGAYQREGRGLNWLAQAAQGHDHAGPAMDAISRREFNLIYRRGSQLLGELGFMVNVSEVMQGAMDDVLEDEAERIAAGIRADLRDLTVGFQLAEFTAEDQYVFDGVVRTRGQGSIWISASLDSDFPFTFLCNLHVEPGNERLLAQFGEVTDAVKLWVDRYFGRESPF